MFYEMNRQALAELEADIKEMDARLSCTTSEETGLGSQSLSL